MLRLSAVSLSVVLGLPNVHLRCDIQKHVFLFLRQNGIGMGSMCARAGGVIAPIIYLMRNINHHAPMVVFGLCPLIGAALTMFLPETAHSPLPDTIEDVESTSFR